MTKITSEQIIRNEPEVLSIPEWGEITVKLLTEGERREAEIEAMKHPMWDKMDLLEKGRETTRQMAIKMIVEPKLSKEEIENSNEQKLGALIYFITQWYREKTDILLGFKAKQEMNSFLEQKKDREP